MVYYSPEAGLTIKEAVVRAVLKAREAQDLVELDINDMRLYITSRADIDKYIRLYHYKKDMEYRLKFRGSR